MKTNDVSDNNMNVTSPQVGLYLSFKYGCDSLGVTLYSVYLTGFQKEIQKLILFVGDDLPLAVLAGGQDIF